MRLHVVARFRLAKLGQLDVGLLRCELDVLGRRNPRYVP